ncbi:MAG: hypothetical protein AB7S38_22060 [Vulcanimicrobiota bacterium]
MRVLLLILLLVWSPALAGSPSGPKTPTGGWLIEDADHVIQEEILWTGKIQGLKLQKYQRTQQWNEYTYAQGRDTSKLSQEVIGGFQKRGWKVKKGANGVISGTKGDMDLTVTITSKSLVVSIGQR